MPRNGKAINCDITDRRRLACLGTARAITYRMLPLGWAYRVASRGMNGPLGDGELVLVLCAVLLTIAVLLTVYLIWGM